MRKKQKITTCNQLDLETLGFWPIMLKNLPSHYGEKVSSRADGGVWTTMTIVTTL
jgi:hypothetical protein